MERSILYSKASAFTERNTTLYFVLGLTSLSRNLNRTLEATPCQIASRVVAENGVASDQASDRFLEFMLGFIAVSSRFSQRIEVERSKSESGAGLAADRPTEAVSVILRDFIR